jgi:hypothetical protein
MRGLDWITAQIEKMGSAIRSAAVQHLTAPRHGGF